MRKIEPIRVFEIFEEISEIPRCTGDEKAIAAYIISFAKGLGLGVHGDEIGNVIIQKSGTKGYENEAPLILQGHMDMLCIKDMHSNHDFSKDPIRIMLSGDLVYSEETALGSDNGIAIAFYLALLESEDIPHPDLEVIFTVKEQSGLIGAKSLDVSGLKGRNLINMDSEAEGEFIIGCAGEKRLKLERALNRENHGHDVEVGIKLHGLKGGHSGLNIHLNNGNAIVILAQLFRTVQEDIPTALVSISAGDKYNVIPNYGEMKILIHHDSVASFKKKMAAFHTRLEASLNESEVEIDLNICPSGCPILGSRHSFGKGSYRLNHSAAKWRCRPERRGGRGHRCVCESGHSQSLRQRCHFESVSKGHE